MRTRNWFALSLALVALLLLPAAALFAKTKPVVKYPTHMGVSAPLRELPARPPAAPSAPREAPNKFDRGDLPGQSRPENTTEDPIRQNYHPSMAPMPAPIQNFEGLSDVDNTNVLGFAIVPPDTNGDVGPNHYVMWINSIFAVYDKTGTLLGGPWAGNDLFSGFGGGATLAPCDTDNSGDPIVLYDQFADRWFMGQFENPIGAGAGMCVAVSQTPDPLGAWNLYRFATPGNDYPKMGIFGDSYLLSYRNFAGGDFMHYVAMDRDAMIAGGVAAMVDFSLVDGVCQHETGLPAHVEGLTPPPMGAPAPFGFSLDDEMFCSGANPAEDYIRLHFLDVDWSNPGAATLSGPTDVPMPEMDVAVCGGFGSCIDQPNGQLLDPLSIFTMFRLVYHGGTNTLVGTNTVDADGADTAGIRWYQIDDPFGTPTLNQAGTYAPADGDSRWMGSIAIDDGGNMALGFSVSSSTTFPSIRYAGRLVSDATGIMGQSETEMWAGLGSQDGASRWGDYSSMSLDESDGCTFWYTQEYYETTSSFNFKTRIGSFQFLTCVATAIGNLDGTVTNANTAAPIAGATVEAGAYSTVTDGSGFYSMMLPADFYDVTASAFGFTAETVLSVEIFDATTTIQDFALVPGAVVDVDGFVTDGGGAGWPLYAMVEIQPDLGPLETLYTNPQTGYYSTSVIGGSNYTFTVTPMMPGYSPEIRPLTSALVDFQENFGLMPLACDLPGYGFTGTNEATDFDAGIPGTWSVVDNGTGLVVWTDTDPGGRGNMTPGGSGGSAIADSDADCDNTCADFDVNTDLLTPVFDASADTELTVSWKQDFNDLSSIAQVDVFDGASWVTIADYSGANSNSAEAVLTPVGAGVANAQVRWHYEAGWDWWWQVDDASVVGDSFSCTYVGGAGVFYGNVYDENTGLGVNGATVELDTGETATTMATPDDPNVDDGWYQTFVPLSGLAPGIRTVTASSPGYGDVSSDEVVIPNGAKIVDFVLPAALLSANPTELRNRLPRNSVDSMVLTLANAGGIDVAYDLLEINAPTAAPIFGPIAAGPSVNWEDKQAYMDSLTLASDGSVIDSDRYLETESLLAAGDYVFEFASGLALPYGLTYDVNSNDLWVGNPAVGGGDDLDHQFLPDGTATGNTIDTAPFVSVNFAADMAFNPTTGMLWQLDVAEGDCIHELDPISMAVTGTMICPGFPRSQRGLAYDAGTDSYYVGTFQDDANDITQFLPDGTITRTVPVGLPVVGLAYSADSGYLYVQVNASPNTELFVLDTATPNLDPVGTITMLDSSGLPAFTDDYSGAGLSLDCDGTLWAANFNGTVYAAESGETPASCGSDIPWLDEIPTSGIVAGGGGTELIDVTFTSGAIPQCFEAQVQVQNDGPYGTTVLPAGMTVQYDDVAMGSMGDAHIHGLATDGISYGCGLGGFCPDDSMLRRNMAVWLVRANWGAGFAPPPAVGLFGDVFPESYGADEIEWLYTENIISGCSAAPLLFCPDDGATRAQMAKFQLKTLEGAAYVPPAATGLFGDVSLGSGLAKWVEELYNRGITSGCSAAPLLYCPDESIPRKQNAIFTQKTFGLTKCVSTGGIQ